MPRRPSSYTNSFLKISLSQLETQLVYMLVILWGKDEVYHINAEYATHLAHQFKYKGLRANLLAQPVTLLYSLGTCANIAGSYICNELKDNSFYWIHLYLEKLKYPVWFYLNEPNSLWTSKHISILIRLADHFLSFSPYLLWYFPHPRVSSMNKNYVCSPSQSCQVALYKLVYPQSIPSLVQQSIHLLLYRLQ